MDVPPFPKLGRRPREAPPSFSSIGAASSWRHSRRPSVQIHTENPSENARHEPQKTAIGNSAATQDGFTVWFPHQTETTGGRQGEAGGVVSAGQHGRADRREPAPHAGSR